MIICAHCFQASFQILITQVCIAVTKCGHLPIMHHFRAFMFMTFWHTISSYRAIIIVSMKAKPVVWILASLILKLPTAVDDAFQGLH